MPITIEFVIALLIGYIFGSIVFSILLGRGYVDRFLYWLDAKWDKHIGDNRPK